MPAQYQLKEKAFFAPNLLPAGTVITYDGSPGHHLDPLNEEAVARMEAWYEEEMPELNEKGERTGRKVKLHAMHRFAPQDAPEVFGVTVDALPVEENEKVMSLAEIITAGKASTNQRPPPVARPKTRATAAPGEVLVQSVPPSQTTITKNGVPSDAS